MNNWLCQGGAFICLLLCLTSTELAAQGLCDEGTAEQRLECLIEIRCSGLKEADAANCYRQIIMVLLGGEVDDLQIAAEPDRDPSAAGAAPESGQTDGDPAAEYGLDPKRKQEPISRVDGVIVALGYDGARRLVFRLDNDQVWRQNEPSNIGGRFFVERGDRVAVVKRLFGFSLTRADGGKTNVHRVDCDASPEVCAAMAELGSAGRDR